MSSRVGGGGQGLTAVTGGWSEKQGKQINQPMVASGAVPGRYNIQQHHPSIHW